MTKCEFRSTIDVDLALDTEASDAMVVAAARVSTLGSESTTPEDMAKHQGLINFLVKNRHGSPFEHNQFIFRVRAPIFVWREHMRHRIGFSYNEESGRYKQLEPIFYVPGAHRNLVQTGKAGAYEFERGTRAQYQTMVGSIEYANQIAYDQYELMMIHGICREVARMVLPVNIYSTAYVTMNARSLMNFLSLRTKNEASAYPSYPMREIEMVAEKYEQAFAAKMPMTHAAFNANGRVAP